MKFVATLVALITALSVIGAGKMSPLYDISIKDVHGKDLPMKSFAGKVILIVNVASECGYTGQYAGLETLYGKFKGKGLFVLGVPCNQFGGQEPGDEATILKFCTSNYNVTFPLTAKVDVNGPKQHPLYAALTGKSSPFPGKVGWNFGKFLVGRDGKILKRFESDAEPESSEVIGAIETALAAK